MIIINLNGEPFPDLREGDVYVTCECTQDCPVYHVERWDGEELWDNKAFPTAEQAVKYAMDLRSYLVVGIYRDNAQRYAETVCASSPDDAVHMAEQRGIEVAGVFKYVGKMVDPNAVA